MTRPVGSAPVARVDNVRVGAAPNAVAFGWSARDEFREHDVTDAVRGKLTSVLGLEVIGSISSAQYRKTTKTPQQIGQELGVRYLLVGKVRWAKGSVPSGTSALESLDAKVGHLGHSRSLSGLQGQFIVGQPEGLQHR